MISFIIIAVIVGIVLFLIISRNAKKEDEAVEKMLASLEKQMKEEKWVIDKDINVPTKQKKGESK